MKRCVLACDLGGSSFRAALVDDAGKVIDLAVIPGQATADPQAWWQSLVTAVDQLGHTSCEIVAIAISAFTRSQILLDRTGIPLRPALLWHDTQAAATLPGLLALLPEHPERAFVNAFHPLARLHFLRETEPGTIASLGCVVEPKDYLNFRLTGRIACDPISSARLLACAPALLHAARFPLSILPAAIAPTEILGVVQPNRPGALRRLAGVPVIAMAHDTWASVLGLGALRPGFAYNLSGTTEVLGLMSKTPHPAEGLLTVQWGEDIHQIGGPSQTGADSIAWLMRLLGQSGPIALNTLLQAERHPQPALFLPYLQGERAPYWNPALRGAFVGLHRDHGPADLAHAVLEGVAFLNRIVLDRAEAACGQPVTEIRFGGGGAANAAWCQIKADITNRPVVVIDETEPGLIGAAIVAFAARNGTSLEAGQQAMVTPRARFTPQPARVAFYRDLFTRFRAAEAALAPLSQELSRMVLPPAPVSAQSAAPAKGVRD